MSPLAGGPSSDNPASKATACQILGVMRHRSLLVPLAPSRLADEGADVVMAEAGADFECHNFVRADRANTSQLDKPGLGAETE